MSVLSGEDLSENWVVSLRSSYLLKLPSTALNACTGGKDTISRRRCTRKALVWDYGTYLPRPYLFLSSGLPHIFFIKLTISREMFPVTYIRSNGSSAESRFRRQNENLSRSLSFPLDDFVQKFISLPPRGEDILTRHNRHVIHLAEAHIFRI